LPARRTLLATLAALLLLAPVASARDWSGDGKPDVLAVRSDGGLLLYRGLGNGHFAGGNQQIGSGWAQFKFLLAPGDFNGDAKPDLLAVPADGRLLLYRGNGAGGFVANPSVRIGSGWQQFTSLLVPGDFSGDGRGDILARKDDGTLLMYRGNGKGGFVTGTGERVGSGWQGFTALLAPGDWNGDRKADLLARGSDGKLWLYRGNGDSGFISPRVQIGSGWGQFTALIAGGDWSGDGKPDVLARAADGRLLMYRGNGRGGWVTGKPEQIGTGWGSLSPILLSSELKPPPPPPPPPPPAPPATPVPDGKVKLNAGIRCTPPGGRLRVNLKIRRRSGSKRPRVRKVVFFVKHGPRKTDRHRPFVVRLRLHRKAGTKGRVYARVFFKRPGSKKLRKKTVSRRFVMCG
jgi:FG-GAP-like repeat